MPTASFHKKTPKPSLTLALLSATLVSAYDRRWLSRPVKSLIPQGGLSPQHLSRLKARLLGPMEALVAVATRRGRPPGVPQPTDDSLLLRELLALVPRDAWTYLPRDRRQTLVEAQTRLKRQYGLTAKRFCELLRVSERTFRSWKVLPPQSPPAKTPPPSPEKESSPRPRGRFDLRVTLPGIQAMADTSPWELLGVPLEIVAVQDPGNRKAKLWESFALDTQQDSKLVVEAITQALEEKPGTQVITDQGTPYLSETTESALEELECDHAPQKEATPTDKATLERAFGIVKQALSPLAELSKKVAQRIPSLGRPELALPLGRILLSVFLRVYEAAPREGGHPLEGRSATELLAISEQQRQSARAEGRSKRLLLGEIHQAYHFQVPLARFIRAHRRHALEDIQEAERRLRGKACRCQVRACDRYFAGILRNVAEENEKRRQEERQEKIFRAREEEEARKARDIIQQRQRILVEHPEEALEEGLRMVSCQWIPREGILLFNGAGLGICRIAEALGSMKNQDPHTVQDRAEVVWKAWTTKNGKEPGRVAAVRRAFEGKLQSFLAGPPSPEAIRNAIISPRPRNGNRPPIRGPDLRN